MNCVIEHQGKSKVPRYLLMSLLSSYDLSLSIYLLVLQTLSYRMTQLDYHRVQYRAEIKDPTGGLEDWRIGGLENWRTGELDHPVFLVLLLVLLGPS